MDLFSGVRGSLQCVAEDQPLDAQEDDQTALAQDDTVRPPAAAPDGDQQAWVGRVIDARYRVEAKLGEGGMGAVYVARHLKLQKRVALKVVRAELAGNGEVAIRFAREAMATAQFEHPHVASATDYGSLPEGGAYLVMQLVQGCSLRARLEQGPMPWRSACRLLSQVADALSAARASGIVHRDLKPDNILVEQREDGSELAKVLDFGIAHISPSTGAAPEGAAPQRALTRAGAVIGTPGYMAPEQAVGDRVDHRADLYALGVVLWECIAGRELWDGPDITTIITRQVSEEPPGLTQVVGDASVPSELDTCVRQLLARRPQDRPDHAGEVRDLLRRLAEGDQPGPARSAGVPPSIANARRWLRAALAGANNLWAAWRAQPRKRQRLQAGAAAVAMIALVSLLAAGDEAQKPKARAKSAPLPEAPAAAVVDSVVQTVEAALTPGVPVALAEEIDTLLEGERRRDRRDAAVVVLAFDPRSAVAPYIIALAELEAARGCRDRKRAIGAIVELADPRALPALERWLRLPKRGCGFLDLEDCYGCIRRALRDGIRSLSGDE